MNLFNVNLMSTSHVFGIPWTVVKSATSVVTASILAALYYRGLGDLMPSSGSCWYSMHNSEIEMQRHAKLKEMCFKCILLDY